MPRLRTLGLCMEVREIMFCSPDPCSLRCVTELSIVCERLEAKLCDTPPPHCRYEEEINRRTAAENEFVLLKKVRGRGAGGPSHTHDGTLALPQG